jgi:hypothetical protein
MDPAYEAVIGISSAMALVGTLIIVLIKCCRNQKWEITPNPTLSMA